jgi:hypothetical protein
MGWKIVIDSSMCDFYDFVCGWCSYDDVACQKKKECAESTCPLMEKGDDN